jgi:ABC-type transporter Mla subunit MlaD
MSRRCCSVVVLVTVLSTACGPAAVGPEPAGPGGPRGPAPGAECAYLRERVTTAATRLSALMQDGEHTSAKYGAISDVLEKLAADMSVPMARDDVRALASDFAAAARAATTAARDVSALLARGERAKSLIAAGSEKQAFISAVKRVADACRESGAPDCGRAVGVLQALGQVGPSVSLINSARAALRGLAVTTPALGAALPDVDSALARLANLMSAAEILQRDGPRLVSAYEQAARQFGGLSTRADRICGGAGAH